MFHIQLHQDTKSGAQAVESANKALMSDGPAIGLDFDRNFDPLNKSLKQCSSEEIERLKKNQKDSNHGKEGVTKSIDAFLSLGPGQVGLVRGGAKPVALVCVTGPYEFNPDAEDGDVLWFRHRYPVRVLGWYDQDVIVHPDIQFVPPSRGTCQRLTNPNSPTYMALERWLAYKEKDARLDAIIKVLEQSRQIILVGPPGTGKTHEARRIAAAITGNDPLRWNLVQFHPSYNYEDFVRGLKSETEGGVIRYVAKHGIFGQACKAAERADKAPYVLIIDEINRANVAAVFGELLYGLEYREAVRTPYEIDGNSELTVPKNLLVIGTMNTADRSIGHIDYAVRRRFAFINCAPDKGVIDAHSFADPNDRALALQMFDAVAKLFKEPTSLLSAGHHARDLQVGHTYFIGTGVDGLRSRFKYQVEPLLREYLADGVFKPEAEKVIDTLSAQFGG